MESFSQSSLNMGVDTAKAHRASVVVPSKIEIIHPPDFWSTSNGDVDADLLKVAKLIGEDDWDKRAIVEGRAGWNSGGLLGNFVELLGGSIVAETSEAEDTVWSLGVATKGSTVEVESKAACQAMITIGNVSGVAVCLCVGNSLRVRAIETGDELSEKRLGRGKVWIGGWWDDDKAI